MFIESKALEIANNLEINGKGCECYARSRSDCGCPDAIWAEDFIIEAAKELRRLYYINKENSQVKRLQKINDELLEALCRLRVTSTGVKHRELIKSIELADKLIEKLTEYPDHDGFEDEEDTLSILVGNKWYNQEGVLHREDGPAIVTKNGDKFWYFNGKIHREGGPAVERANGDLEWYVNGKLHREDGPAVIFAYGSYIWFKNGKVHRENGPAIERPNGDKEWFQNGVFHREDGPAVEYTNGHKEWRINGFLHRKDGPAIENPDGNCEWWLDGIRWR